MEHITNTDHQVDIAMVYQVERKLSQLIVRAWSVHHPDAQAIGDELARLKLSFLRTYHIVICGRRAA